MSLFALLLGFDGFVMSLVFRASIYRWAFGLKLICMYRYLMYYKFLFFTVCFFAVNLFKSDTMCVYLCMCVLCYRLTAFMSPCKRNHSFAVLLAL